MLRGGLRLSPNKDRALTVLVTGPPGTGKSTLALELCHRWGSQGPGLSSLYITSESDNDSLQLKAAEYGWHKEGEQETKVLPRTEIHYSERFARWRPDEAGLFTWFQLLVGTVTVWRGGDIERFPSRVRNYLRRGPLHALKRKQRRGQRLQNRLDRTEARLPYARPDGRIERRRRRLKKKLGDHETSYKDLFQRRFKIGIDPDVVVVDSLNTVEPSQQADLFRAFMHLIEADLKVIIVILEDRGDGFNQSASWAYISDVIIRMDSSESADNAYLTRSIEIVKARYQEHIWGRQRLKLYPCPPTPTRGTSQDDRRRAHPYNVAGGVFIYPSIHYYLSNYKRSPRAGVGRKYLKTGIGTLDDVLDGGLPEARCTGLIGIRGGHKSHLSYETVLRNLTDERSGCGLVVSLRDSEEGCRGTLQRILNENESLCRGIQARLDTDDTTKLVDQLIREELLEILYYPPGYVTPEEFFHRLYVTVVRLRSTNPGSRTVALFNSLDQLSSRFPLCAAEQVFVPGLVEMLSAEQVTSLFVAVEEEGQPPEQYGLLSMADALLRFSSELVERERWATWLYEAGVTDTSGMSEARRKKARTDYNALIARSFPEKIQTVAMHIERYAGGQAAGKGGFFELINAAHPNLEPFDARGLVFAPFGPLATETAGRKPH
ncbi:MAG: hypothetical protein AAGD35_04455 [Actinomycetota bacterium]